VSRAAVLVLGYCRRQN